MKSTSAPDDILFRRMFLTNFTPALAKPLLFGLYGVVVCKEIEKVKVKKRKGNIEKRKHYGKILKSKMVKKCWVKIVSKLEK